VRGPHSALYRRAYILIHSDNQYFGKTHHQSSIITAPRPHHFTGSLSTFKPHYFLTPIIALIKMKLTNLIITAVLSAPSCFAFAPLSVRISNEKVAFNSKFSNSKLFMSDVSEQLKKKRLMFYLYNHRLTYYPRFAKSNIG
jgi:hypothetical protein